MSGKEESKTINTQVVRTYDISTPKDLKRSRNGDNNSNESPACPSLNRYIPTQNYI
jgi:hypothetical protein